MSDAYQGSGGWSGGSPLMGGQGGVYGGTDSVLGSYMQSMKQYDPLTGSMKTARPAQSNAQMSSLARTIAAPEGTAAQYNTQPTAATPTTQAPVTVNVQAPQAAGVSSFGNAMLSASQPAISRGALAVPAAAAPAVMEPARSRGPSFSGNPQVQENMAASAVPYAGQNTIITGAMGANGTGTNTLRRWDSAKQQYVAMASLMATPSPDGTSSQYQLIDNSGRVIAQGTDAYTRFIQMKGFLGGGVLYQGANEGEALQKALAANQKAIDENAAAVTAARNDYRAQGQQLTDSMAAQAAQDALDRASAFNLGNALQAPNTSKVDAAGAADLARVISKYAASGYGPEASSLAAIGTRDAATQATVNKVNHDSAYADAYNSNYGVFADAVRARRDTNIEASGQRLKYDMQGVSQAVQTLMQQAQQLGDTAKTATTSALLPLQKALQDYDLAVSQYRADSDQAKQAAQTVLSLGASLLAGGVSK